MVICIVLYTKEKRPSLEKSRRNQCLLMQWQFMNICTNSMVTTSLLSCQANSNKKMRENGVLTDKIRLVRICPVFMVNENPSKAAT